MDVDFLIPRVSAALLCIFFVVFSLLQGNLYFCMYDPNVSDCFWVGIVVYILVSMRLGWHVLIMLCRAMYPFLLDAMTTSVYWVSVLGHQYLISRLFTSDRMDITRSIPKGCICLPIIHMCVRNYVEYVQMHQEYSVKSSLSSIPTYIHKVH